MSLARCLILLISAMSLLPAQNNLPPVFKASGSVMAPITIEIYTDYQCPHCRALYQETLPSLINEFVKTGKVRLVHRDFPLPQFQYSKLAMHYANAAGQIGKFEEVSTQLFESQPEWGQTGNVEGSLAKVLSPAELEKVRNIVKNDTHLDDSVVRDVAVANDTDHVSSTPTVVIIYKGKREAFSGGMPYAALKSYLNGKLSQ